MVTFDEIHPDEQVLEYDDVGFLHDSGGFTNGKLILTQKRLVFVIGGGLFSGKQRTDHAIDMSQIDSVTIEPAENLGVHLRVDFTTLEGTATVRYHGRVSKAQKMVELINQRVDAGILR
ncbi:MAG: hypothetical protein ACXACG_02910 [Candidatus Thorarchaeota archaeon]|jgi:hypothetical protein